MVFFGNTLTTIVGLNNVCATHCQNTYQQSALICRLKLYVFFVLLFFLFSFLFFFITMLYLYSSQVQAQLPLGKYQKNMFWDYLKAIVQHIGKSACCFFWCELVETSLTIPSSPFNMLCLFYFSPLALAVLQAPLLLVFLI